MSHTNILTLKIVLEVYKSCWICKLVPSSYKLVYSKNIYSYSENQHKTKQWILIYKLIWPANQLVFDHGDNSQKLAHNPFNYPPAKHIHSMVQNALKMWCHTNCIKKKMVSGCYDFLFLVVSLHHKISVISRKSIGGASSTPSTPSATPAVRTFSRRFHLVWSGRYRIGAPR